jgi:predicted transcriptional regulator
MLWNDVGFLLRNKTARKILEHMISKNIPVMPSEMAEALDMSLKNVSTRLGYLLERGLIKCLNPEEKKGRLYVVTKKGKEVLKKARDRK